MNIVRRITVVLFIFTLIIYNLFKFIEYKEADHAAPVITMNSDHLTISVKESEEKLLEGIEAIDDEDGDISSEVIIEDISGFINDKRIITYVVSDSHNNVTRATRELAYDDYTKPTFKITSPLSYDLDTIASDILKDVDAYDVIDGDISNNIKVSFNSPLEPGTYEAEFTVTNSSGDTVHLKAPVEIYSSSITPQIYLKDYVIYKKVGDSIDPYDYLKTISMGKNNSSKGEEWKYYRDRIKIENKFNSTKAGTYVITYEVTINGFTGKSFLVVVVED
ncbi:hypothetical protein ACPWSR_06640 [Alloiococcus sp. CFN-8]|uniref:hypothetical protein n=1 Tax=Alloiococcus sp. CFN-8 TaxID=3416081 RepID=UPI003CEFD6C0